MSPAESFAGSPLRAPGFRWFFAGRTVSQAGSRMAPTALALAVLNESGRTSDLGLVLAAQSVPMLGLLLLAGVVADRVSRRTILLVSHLGAAATQAAVATVLLTGQYRLWLVCLLALSNGCFAAFTSPAVRGVVPSLVPGDGETLRRANALLATSTNVCRVVGPSLGAGFVVTVGGGWAVAVDAVSYLVAAGCLARLRLPALPRAATSILGDLREGWRSFVSLRWVWVVCAAFTAVNLVLVGAWGVLGPVVATDTIGQAAWGVVLSVRAVGTLLAGAALYRLRVRRLLALGQLVVVTAAAPLVVLAVLDRVPTTLGIGLLAATAFLAGLGSGVEGVAWQTSLHQHVPQRLQSRIAAYDELLAFGAVPIGQALAAPAAALLGVVPVVLGAAGITVVAALAPLGEPTVRNLGHGR